MSTSQAVNETRDLLHVINFRSSVTAMGQKASAIKRRNMFICKKQALKLLKVF